MVSWYGATYYCQWLTAYVNACLKEKGYWRVPNYRLPSEFEWVFAANGRDLQGLNRTMCDSATMVSPMNEECILKSTRSSKPNADKIFGLNDNALEWTNDNFYSNIGVLIDWGMVSNYNEEETLEAVTRKHGLSYNENIKSSCGRTGRTRAHYFSDTGFRIVQTYLGRSSGIEF